MYFPFFVAKRYLFGRSRLGATGWISLISAIAIAVVTAGLVCVLAVYNGYVAILLEGESNSIPELLIKPHEGMTFSTKSVESKLRQSDLVKHYSRILHSEGLLRSQSGEFMTEIYGVDESYLQVVQMDSALAEGSFLVPSTTEGEEDVSPTTIGIALAIEGVGKGGETELSMLFPRREGLINPLALASAFVEQKLRLTGVLGNYNEQINKRVYTTLKGLQGSLNYTDDIASAIALKLHTGLDTEQSKARLSQLLGEEFIIQNREEQQPEQTLLIKAEKFMVYAIMCFILVLATFNLASSLAMLIMEKENDIKSLKALGAKPKQISSIFAMTGLLISSLGALLGLCLGIAFCLLQEHFGFIYSGEGLSRMPFPIDLKATDLFYIMLSTIVVAILSSSIPTRLIKRASFCM